MLNEIENMDGIGSKNGWGKEESTEDGVRKSTQLNTMSRKPESTQRERQEKSPP